MSVCVYVCNMSSVRSHVSIYKHTSIPILGRFECDGGTTESEKNAAVIPNKQSLKNCVANFAKLLENDCGVITMFCLSF